MSYTQYTFAGILAIVLNYTGKNADQLAIALSLDREIVLTWQSGTSAPDTGEVTAIVQYVLSLATEQKLFNDLKETTLKYLASSYLPSRVQEELKNMNDLEAFLIRILELPLENKYTFSEVLSIMLNSLEKNDSTLAKKNDSVLNDSALARAIHINKSSVSRWRNGGTVPVIDHFPAIVAFVLSHIDETKKESLRRDLLCYLPGLLSRVSDNLTQLDDSSFLQEIFHLSISKISRGRVVSPPAAKPAEPSLSIPLPSPWITPICALLAAVTGGLAWNILNLLLKWPYFMGSPDSQLTGFPAFLWGIVTTMPIPLFAFFALKQLGILKGKCSLAILAYTITGGFMAVAFFQPEVRSGIAALQLDYGTKEAVRVIVFSIIMSLPPYFLAMSVSRPALLTLDKEIMYAIFPTVVTVLVFFTTLIIDRPMNEVALLRGLLVGLALRLSMFGVFLHVFKRSKTELLLSSICGSGSIGACTEKSQANTGPFNGV